MKFLMTTVLLFSILMFSGCGGSDDGGSEKGLNSTSSNNKGLAPVDDTEDTPALDEEDNTEIDSSNDDNTLAGGDTAMGGDTSIAENTNTNNEDIPSDNQSDNIYQAKKYDLEEETYAVDVLHEINDADDNLNEGSPVHNSLVNYKGYAYMLYVVDSNDSSNSLRPKIVKISHADKTSTSAYIDLPDYHTRNDNHHKWSLGVDKDGYLHIAGDMHNYSIFGAGKDYVGYSVDHMPARYKSGRVNYWKSDAPENINSFTWLGDSATQAPQGTGHTYIHFAYDQEDNLYYYGRVAQTSSGGAYRAFNISKYDAQTQTWNSYGEKNDFDNEALIWEDNGEDGGKYSKIHGWVSFDLNNKMHAVAPILNKEIDTDINHLSTDIAYVTSDFGGKNLLNANGNSLGNSLRVDGSSSFTQAEITHSNTTQLLSTYASVIADYQGRPIVMSRVNGEKDNRFHRFENGMWVDHGTCGISGDNDSRFYIDRLGVITMIQDNESFTRMWSVDEGIRTVRVKYNLKALKSLNIDARHLMKTGEIIAIANRVDKANDPLQIVRIKITRPSDISYPEDESLN